MKRDKGFENLSGQMSSAEIGLGWLDGMTLRTSTRAVSVRPHRHQHMEVILCLRGELSYEIDDRPPVSLGADMGLVINARTRHALRNNAESPGERIGLHLLRTMSPHRDFAVFRAKDYADFQRILSAAASRPFRLSPQLKSDARKLAGFLKRPADGISSAERGLVRILCCSILYNLVQTLSGPQPAANGPQPMDEAVRYLEKRYAQPFDVGDLVRRLIIPAPHCTRSSSGTRGSPPTTTLFASALKRPSPCSNPATGRSQAYRMPSVFKFRILQRCLPALRRPGTVGLQGQPKSKRLAARPRSRVNVHQDNLD